MAHIWYYCPMVKDFWLKIFCIYRKISKSEIQSDISISILSMIPGSMKTIKADILRHMIIAARTIIAWNWRKAKSPTIIEWVCEMSELQSIEEIIMFQENLSKQTQKTSQHGKSFRPLQFLYNNYEYDRTPFFLFLSFFFFVVLSEYCCSYV